MTTKEYQVVCPSCGDFWHTSVELGEAEACTRCGDYFYVTDNDVLRVQQGSCATWGQALGYAYLYGERIRIHYGDTTTGRDWMEEYDTMGTVSKTGGSNPRYILLPRKDSIGGGAIGESIVKITAGKKVLYCNANYHQPFVHVVHEDMYDVYFDKTLQVRFETWDQAARYVRFIRGDVNTKGGRA